MSRGQASKGGQERPAGGTGLVAPVDPIERVDGPESETDVDPLRVQRDLSGWSLWLVRGVALVLAGYFLLTGLVGADSPQLHRGLFIGGMSLLIFLVYPLRQKATGRSRTRIPFYDLLLGLVAAGVCAYYVVEFPAMAARSGAPTTGDTIAGALLVLIVLEVTRRTTGWLLPIIGVIAIAYVFAGPDMPGILRHGGYSTDRFISMSFQSFNGIFGLVAGIFANYIFLFIIFGTFLAKSGAARFFVDLPYALAGTLRGGPAKVALVVSALMGSINGSAVANVMTTGTFTVPLMRRTGYSKEFSGGVEAAASTGGGILPPIMGAGAFLLAEFTGIPYGTVVLYSIVPALMYFAGVYFLIDFTALKNNLAGIDRAELASPMAILRDGWFFFLPLVVVFTLIIMNFSPAYAGFWGTLAAAAVGMLPYQGERLRLSEHIHILWESGIRCTSIAGVAGTLGIIIGVMNLTGLGLKFTDVIISASGGVLILALILVTLASWFLGAGLTVTSSYVIVAVLAAPALQELGVGLLAAHLIILWVSQDANVTPPICVAAFAAASIAGGRMMKTGWEAWKLARGLYIIPFLMAYTGLVDGPLTEILHISLTGTLGIYMFAAAVSGFLRKRLTVIERIVAMGSSLLFISPDWLTNGGGLAVAVLLWLYQSRGRTRSAEPGPAIEGPAARAAAEPQDA